MDEAYRLVFRGEVLDGQHPAVVKKRLIDALKLSDDQAETLFSGSTVVLKRDADTKTAARYQGLFKKAGARLRVMPVEESDAPSPDQRAAAGAEPKQRSESVGATPGMQVLPVGADVLGVDERRTVPTVEVDISHLEIQVDAPVSTSEPAAPAGVAVPEFSVAELGADLVEHSEPETVDVDPHFDLAEPGAVIPTIPADATPAVDLSEIRFDVAERGADIGVPRNRPPPVAPDVSHLSLVAE